MLYFSILFVLFLFSVFEFFNSYKLSCVEVKFLSFNKVVYIYISFFLFFIAAFRYKTGRDWQEYMFFFENCITTHSMWESGFVMLNKIFKSSFNSFYFMQFCILLFSSFAIYKNFYDRSKYFIFTMFIYFVTFFLPLDMAQTRQHIAIAILVIAQKYIREKKLMLWTLWIFIAMQFHISAICAFPLYFTTYKKVSKIGILFLFSLSLFMTFFGLSITRNILSGILEIPFMPSRIKNIGNGYLNSSIYGQQIQFSSGIGFWIKNFFIIFILIFYCQKNGADTKYYMCNFLIALLLQSLGRNFDQFSRIAYYYLICGGGICAYNLLIDSKAFFKGLPYLRIIFCVLFLLFNVYNFYTSWTSMFLGHSYKTDYTPYKLFIFNL